MPEYYKVIRDSKGCLCSFLVKFLAFLELLILRKLSSA